MNSRNTRNRFNKLSLKKNKMSAASPKQRFTDSSGPDLVVLDDSLDCAESELKAKHLKKPEIKTYSPIVIDDSAELSCESLLRVSLTDKTPSRSGNVSFNASHTESLAQPPPRPHGAGWSPAQGFVAATPRRPPAPATPRDSSRVSLHECSLRDVQQSQRKLLSELYGEVWRTIPTLFKPKETGSIDAVTKKLEFCEDGDSDKENDIRAHIAANKDLYLTGSDAKRKMAADGGGGGDKRSKKKLYTERAPATPEPRAARPAPRRAATTAKKTRAKSVTELVAIMKDKFAVASEVGQEAKVASGKTVKEVSAERLSFVASLGDNVPAWRCHPEALQYRDQYKLNRDRLARRLFAEFNETVFGGGLDADLQITWDTKLRTTAGTTTNRLVRSAGARLRSSAIKLSEKVVDTPARLRDTLLHEMCHAATWLLDGELRAGHGPLWRRWATSALRRHPALGAVQRCHDLDVHHKYSYKCRQCGYTVKRHSKSLDVTKKCCGYCRGAFELIVHRRGKDGAVVSTPARKGQLNEFARYVQQHYGSLKQGSGRSHADVMRTLGEQFAVEKRGGTPAPTGGGWMVT